MPRCEECKANKVCDHNRFGFENCGNFIPNDVAPRGDVIEEYRQKVNAKMGKHTHLLGKEYVQRILREVAKEMKGE